MSEKTIKIIVHLFIFFFTFGGIIGSFVGLDHAETIKVFWLGAICGTILTTIFAVASCITQKINPLVAILIGICCGIIGGGLFAIVLSVTWLFIHPMLFKAHLFSSTIGKFISFLSLGAISGCIGAIFALLSLSDEQDHTPQKSNWNLLFETHIGDIVFILCNIGALIWIIWEKPLLILAFTIVTAIFMAIGEFMGKNLRKALTPKSDYSSKENSDI